MSSIAPDSINHILKISPKHSKPETSATPVDILTHALDFLPNGDFKGQCKAPGPLLQRLKAAGFGSFRMPGEPEKVLNSHTIGPIVSAVIEMAQIRLKLGAFTLATPSFKQHVEQIRHSYSLKELFVLPEKAGEAGLPGSLAEQGAMAFHDIVSRFQGGGQTMHEMMPWIQLNRSKEMTVVATNYVTRTPKGKVYDSSYLAMQLHWLYSVSKARIIGIPPLPTKSPADAAAWHGDLFNRNQGIQKVFKYSLNADIVFLGAGNYDKKSPTMTKLYRHVGIDGAEVAARDNPPVGDINFCLFDGAGSDITLQVLNEHAKGFNLLEHDKFKAKSSFFDHVEAYSHPFLAAFNIACLQRFVRADKTVVVVAGGKDGDKAPALRALMKARVINGLVTDPVTLARLVALDAKCG